MKSQMKYVIFAVMPLLVAAVSLYLAADLSTYASNRHGSIVFIALLCIYAHRYLAAFSSFGVGRCCPQHIPPAFFIWLGWIILFVSLILASCIS